MSALLLPWLEGWKEGGWTEGWTEGPDACDACDGGKVLET